MVAEQNRDIKSGFIAVNKPCGVSSARVVGRIKFLLRQGGEKIKVGHMGTLDVEAEGVLIVAVGKATKLFNEFLKKTKTYETVFEFGKQTDTDDWSGRVIANGGVIPTKKQIFSAMPAIKNQTLQMPPQFCANKIGGKRAYDLARQGEAVVLKPKPIKIYAFELLEQVDENAFKFKIECSSGTYIRAICRDLSSQLSTYGITRCIIRTICGGIMLKDCLNFESLNYEEICKNVLNMPALPG